MKTTGSAWSETEKDYHINEKELLTNFYSLKSFKFDFQGKHAQTFSVSGWQLSHSRQGNF